MANVQEIGAQIDRELPEICRGVIARHLDLSDPSNLRFWEDPDDRLQHQTEWHQWGIITHTRRFLAHFQTDLPCYLSQWNVWIPVQATLAEKVDGATKGSLLEIAILLHDIGKYAARRLGRHRFHFTHHEILSGKIIREELQLESRGLSSAQIDYIALTAQDHFVLGLVRRRAREEGAYDEAYASSRSFAELVTQIVADHPQDYLEIGVLFLGDSLAKANPGEGPERALSQYDLNIDVARRYLQLALGN